MFGLSLNTEMTRRVAQMGSASSDLFLVTPSPTNSIIIAFNQPNPFS